MSIACCNKVYDDNHDCVSWSGLSFSDDEHLSAFLTTKVVDRLDDSEGSEEYRDHLSGLALTGLGEESLSAVLNADIPEERSWAAGEALAEAFLEEEHNVVFPWNMERDKRNPFGSLPGADIVGFITEGEDCLFALGEVKTSLENVPNPQVMSGRSGHMGHQLDKLANNLTTICQLLKWLLPRVKNTEFQINYDKAAISFFNSGNRKIVLYGVLIRDTVAHEKDLSVRGKALREKLAEPTRCQLIGLYLPWSIGKLVGKIRNGGAS